MASILHLCILYLLMYEVVSRLECCAYAGGKLVLRNNFASYLENIGEECRLAGTAEQGRRAGGTEWEVAASVA